MGVGFRKKDCGIEGKWKGGSELSSWGPGFSPFPQRVEKGMWIPGFRRWKVTVWAGLARVWMGWVLQGGRRVHSLHRVEGDGGNVGVKGSPKGREGVRDIFGRVSSLSRGRRRKPGTGCGCWESMPQGLKPL